jgi:hypothetical protein
MVLPGQMLMGFIIVTVAFLLAAYISDCHHQRAGLLNDDIFLIVQRQQQTRQNMTEQSRLMRTKEAATPQDTEDPTQDKKCGCSCSCWTDICLLLQHICTEAFASMGDLCYFIKEMKNNLQECCCSYGSSLNRRQIHEAFVKFFTHIYVDAIHGVTACKLHIQVDDVQFFLAKAREERASPMKSRSSTTSLALITYEGELVEKVRREFKKFSKCSQLPILFFWMFASRCTLIEVLRSSVFIPALMSAMLFACDMHAAAALGALFFQASGGALAEDADERCEPQGIGERLGRLIAIGVATVFVGMLPSMVLARLHQRDFVEITGDEASAVDVQWKKTRRLWLVQDRVIYILSTLLLTFCMFFNLVFIANVTAEDGMAWFVCVVISTAQTVLGVPFIMTVITFMGALLARPFARVQRESCQLCLCDSANDSNENNFGKGAELKRVGSFHRAPKSRWQKTHRPQRRATRSSRGRTRSPDPYPSLSRMLPVQTKPRSGPAAMRVGRTASLDLDWHRDKPADLDWHRANSSFGPSQSISCANSRSPSFLCCQQGMSSEALRLQVGAGGDDECEELVAMRTQSFTVADVDSGPVDPLGLLQARSQASIGSMKKLTRKRSPGP